MTAQTETPPPSTSPSWGPTTKLVIGLTFAAICAALLIQFRNIIGPLILAFILTYLLYPVATGLSRLTRLSWRAAVNIVFLLVLIVVIGLFTASGFAAVQQIQSLIELVQRFLTDLPNLIERISTQVYYFGPFEFDFSQLNLPNITQQLLSAAQTVLGQITSLVSSFAASAATTLGWGLFVLVISYFLLADANRVPDAIVPVDIPGYNEDINRLGKELRKIWNAFLRGQLIIIVLVIISYSILMTILGMRYAVAIAILAGMARFVPYVGPLVSQTITFLVAFFMTSNYFKLEPIFFAILVVGLSIVLDQIFDNIVTPRFFGSTLGVHPAAVLVGAIIAANLIGIIGLLLAAPVLATLKLLGRYVGRKMLDLAPFPDETGSREEPDLPWSRNMRRMKAWLRFINSRRTKA